MRMFELGIVLVILAGAIIIGTLFAGMEDAEGTVTDKWEKQINWGSTVYRFEIDNEFTARASDFDYHNVNIGDSYTYSVPSEKADDAFFVAILLMIAGIVIAMFGGE